MWKDKLNFLSKLSFRRTLNAISLTFGFVYSRIFNSTFNNSLPVAIAFEPTTSCNLRCPECPSGLRSFTRPTGMLDTALFKNTITELKDALLYLTFYFQGEPYLHKDFLEMVKYAADLNIYTATSTNAHFLNYENALSTVKSGLDRLIISIDGTSQETYEQYRIGGNLEKVLEGTKNIIQAKKDLNSSTPHVIFQFLVVKPNEHQIDEVEKLAVEMGVDELRLKTAQIYDYENGSSLIPENSKYSRYEKLSDSKYQIKNKLINHCWKMWHSCVITWDGLIVPCCFDKDAQYRMGSLSKTSFRQIWNNPNYLEFRKKLISSRKKIEMCKNCTEGTQIWG
jgi:radical SAM protein with 4Fe4S-binding SPASM domain